MRSQIFRQNVQKARRHTDVWQEISVRNDRKYVRRFYAKPSGVLCAVLTYESVISLREISPLP